MQVFSGSDPSHQEPWCEEYHIKLKISGNKTKQTLFHYILGDIDHRDYPFKEDGTLKHSPCAMCGGAVYRAPRVQPEHLLGLAKQIDDLDALPGRLKLKIRRFCRRGKCLETWAKDPGPSSRGPLNPPLAALGSGDGKGRVDL